MPAAKKVWTTDGVADLIRESIKDRRLAPGQKIIEAQIAKSLDVDRAMVRPAILALIHEGLIEHQANHSPRVRAVELDEALDIVELRFTIEAICISRAATRVTKRDIEVLRGLSRALEQRVEEDDREGFAKLTNTVFETYVRIADHPIAAEILAQLRARNMLLGYRLTLREGRARAALPFWIERIDALCRRDPDGAKKSLRNHAVNVREAMIAFAEAKLSPARGAR